MFDNIYKKKKHLLNKLFLNEKIQIFININTNKNNNS